MNGSATERNALEWLAGAAPEPAVWLRALESAPDRTAPLPCGRRWDVLVLPPRLGPPTLEVLRGLVGVPGPVLGDGGTGRVGFLVPVGTADCWLGTGVRCAGAGERVPVPHPARRTGPGVRWLSAPDGTGRLVDPRPLELAMHEAAIRTVPIGHR
ncbi:hypothetical protein GCM10027160_40160 [Streptomyces calidiresistens]|uniref:DNA primase/polymerase bifunctional N-terminal domain-containing protein n=1 Tax=Streptomyces calidiresistens TaxID=1485586 RepID=A0A7W3T8P8_9ACTN|nr:hypothetical protein [Streptomyces calidiresistens]MBB0232968.1 hypothetical protein [Streptomyces calidiresistens]